MKKNNFNYYKGKELDEKEKTKSEIVKTAYDIVLHRHLINRRLDKDYNKNDYKFLDIYLDEVVDVLKDTSITEKEIKNYLYQNNCKYKTRENSLMDKFTQIF